MEERPHELSRKLEVIKALQKDIKEAGKIDTPAGYAATWKKITRRKRKEIILQTFNKVAAVIALPLLISTCALLYFIFHTDEDTSLAYSEITASPGAIIKTVLPDGSEAWLNSESTLRYPNKFTANKREVQLTGEAFFDVKTNPRQPFEVALPSGLKVIAKGTAFNVSAYNNDIINEIVLQEGIVDITYGDKLISMIPSEMVSLDKEQNTILKSTPNIYEKTGWKEGLLIFRNTPLDEALKKISRRYNVEFIVDKQTEEDYRIRATFSNETITQVMDVLKLAAPIRWEIVNMEQNNDLTYSQQKINLFIN